MAPKKKTVKKKAVEKAAPKRKSTSKKSVAKKVTRKSTPKIVVKKVTKKSVKRVTKKSVVKTSKKENEKNGFILSLTAVIAAFLGFLLPRYAIFLEILALVLGLIALNRMRMNGIIKWRWLARIGIWISAIWIILFIIIAFYYIGAGG